MFVIPADPFDTSTYSKIGDQSGSFYYENYASGIGIAKKLFEVWPTALNKGIEIAKNCRCRRGCTNCIQPAKSYNMSNTDIDKEHGMALAETLLAANERGADRKFLNGLLVPI